MNADIELWQTSGEVLQKARRDAADRYYALAMASLPPGWTYGAFRKSLTGYVTIRDKFLVGPKPVTRKALYIWLHECGHAHLHPRHGCKPSHVMEYEAEQWAHATMRANGIPVPKSMTDRAKRHVANKIRQAERRGAKSINQQAKAYSKGARK